MSDRKLSKYARAWRERVGHASKDASPTPQPSSDDPPVAVASAAVELEEDVALATEPTARTAAVDPPPAGILTADFSSSNVARAELDIDSGVVTVTFKAGVRHRYGGFTVALLEDWRSAKSAGNWFHANVRAKPEKHPHLGAADAAKG